MTMHNPFLDSFLQPATTLPDGSNSPIWPGSAAAKMKIDITVNAQGHVMVLHDEPFPDYLEWIEFDALTGEMTFITAEGKLQDLGMIIHQPMAKFVAMAVEVNTICIRNNEICDMGVLPMTVRNKDEGTKK